MGGNGGEMGKPNHSTLAPNFCYLPPPPPITPHFPPISPHFPPFFLVPGGGGIWHVRNSERRNVAQQNCTTFCRGI